MCILQYDTKFFFAAILMAFLCSEVFSFSPRELWTSEEESNKDAMLL